MFTMDLLDNTAEIRLTAFEPCVEQFYNLVEVINPRVNLTI